MDASIIKTLRNEVNSLAMEIFNADVTRRALEKCAIIEAFEASQRKRRKQITQWEIAEQNLQAAKSTLENICSR